MKPNLNEARDKGSAVREDAENKTPLIERERLEVEKKRLHIAGMRGWDWTLCNITGMRLDVE